MMMTIHRTSEAFDHARKVCAAASELGMKPVSYSPDLLPSGGRVGVEIKFNGITLHWQAGKGFSNNAVEMKCASHLDRDFAMLERVFGEPMYFQSEYMVDMMDWNTTASAFASDKPSGHAVVFDAVPVRVWNGTDQSDPLITRKVHLKQAFAAAQPRLIVPSRFSELDAANIDLIEDAAGACWDEKHEGAVVKDLDSPFVRCPSSYWLKIKKVETFDLKIIGAVATGEGNAMRIRSIVFRDFAGDEFKVGSISESQRFALADLFRADDLVGRVAEIKGIQDGDKIISTSFLRMRPDK